MQPDPGGVLYRFFDLDSVLLYVGRTINPTYRWPGHRSGKVWWDEVSTITLTRYATAEALDEAERGAIREEAPRYNRVRFITPAGPARQGMVGLTVYTGAANDEPLADAAARALAVAAADPTGRSHDAIGTELRTMTIAAAGSRAVATRAIHRQHRSMAETGAVLGISRSRVHRLVSIADEGTATYRIPPVQWPFMADRDRESAALVAAIADLRAAFVTAKAIITDTVDPHEAFALATTLVEELRVLTAHVGDLRAAAVWNIHEAEKTSLATLGKRLGISKTRADQLVRAGRAARGETQE